MNGETLATGYSAFKAARTMKLHGFVREDTYAVSVEVEDDRAVSLVLDESETRFTAQQCSEITKHLAQFLLTYSRLGACPVDLNTVVRARLEASVIWCYLIQARTLSTSQDNLQTYSSEVKGLEFAASGSFQRPNPACGHSKYYKLAIALDDDLGIPCLSIDGRAFSFSFEETFWLIEQLWIAGYLLAHFEQPENCPTRE
ncbi:hypothetical protein [Pseudomonas syringae]|uniref:Uncharacterized protein n=1 Tax=Pseudomonas syringae TaxID=317 RepID=A0A085VAD8_PSESX|nr:hypothetical protein [Pseudomonas syringae]KFE52401.1 hypothetical protein IV02_08160 [Pseudomonas syringae]